eukprot:11630222-Alexandrium_andersonii.AAC.1
MYWSMPRQGKLLEAAPAFSAARSRSSSLTPQPDALNSAANCFVFGSTKEDRAKTCAKESG